MSLEHVAETKSDYDQLTRQILGLGERLTPIDKLAKISLEKAVARVAARNCYGRHIMISSVENNNLRSDLLTDIIAETEKAIIENAKTEEMADQALAFVRDKFKAYYGEKAEKANLTE